MALLPDDPKQQKALVAIVVTLGILYAFWTWVYTPRREEVTRLEQRLETLEQQNRGARVIAARGGEELEERMALFERHVMQLEQLIPAREEVPELLNQITAAARDAGVETAFFEPEPEEPGEFYTRKSYSMQVIGEYHDVGRFLTAIASLPRIITPVDLDLNTFTNSGDLIDFQDPVVAAYRIETYVLPGTAPVAGAQGGNR